MLYILFGSISVFYCIVILYASIGWDKHEKTKSHSHIRPFISVIVAVRNEEINIPTIIRYLSLQSYDKTLHEVIFVNDHSSDSTYTILKKECEKHLHFHLYNSPPSHNGKKQALQYAINHAQGNLLLFTDADCTMNEKWIEAYANNYLSKQSQFIFGPVSHTEEKTVLQKIFTLDFLAMIGMQSGFAKQDRAFSCNAANMCISTDIAQSDNNNKYASGDDVFLLHSAKKNPHTKISFIHSRNAMVYTHPPKNIHTFINQRLRWAGKSAGYKDRDAIIISNIIYIENASIFWSAILSIFYIQFLPILLMLLSIKIIIDTYFFIHILPFFGKQKLTILSIPFQLFYFIYITLIPIFAIIYPLHWKGRRIS
ncbi:MAG: glycosyltransferase [Bacteroidales bacterium]|nr:glycosyltransferase [Bacteroidales bacterium]